VLINGRRLLPGDPFDPVPDINAVPTALIKRVEVLTGGASSVYGSDAVAGAVNFILEIDLDGLRIDGQASAFQHNNRDGADLRQALVRRNFAFPTGNVVDGGAQDINAAYGLSFGGGRGHATAYAGYRHLSEATQDRRDYSACATQGRLNSDTFDCGGSLVSPPGTFFTAVNGPFLVVSGREFEEGATRYNYAPFNYYQRPGRRITAGAFAEYEASEAAKPFFELMYMDDRTDAQVAPSGTFGEIEDINCDSPLLSQQQRDLICIDGNFIGQFPEFDDDGNLIAIQGEPEQFVDPVTGATYLRGTLFPLRRNFEGGPRSVDLRHKSLRLLSGIEGDLSKGINYEASILFGRVKFDSANTNDFSVARTRRALDVITDPATGQPACRSALTGEDPACVIWDIFAPGAVTDAALSYLTIAPKQTGEVKQLVATAFSNIDLGEWGVRSKWADENPTVSLGAEYRKDRLDFQPDEFFIAADIAGGDISMQPVSGKTEAKEIFAEARIPLISDRIISSLVVEAGYRHSWQSNPENKFSVGSYKLGGEFAPIRDIRIRASLQRAVRAPNVQELFLPTLPGGFGFDPCTTTTPQATLEQCARTGVTAAQYGHILASPNTDVIPYNVIGGGNPDLDPEKATTKSIGIVLRPRFIPQLSATVDWFDIKLKGAIGGIGPTRIMTTCIETGDPLFCSRIHRDANGSLWMTPEGFVDSRLTNVGSINTRGIDVGINYKPRIGRLGSMDLELLGTWLARLRSNAGGLARTIECAGAYGIGCGVPKPQWRHKARTTWTLEPFSLSLQWRFVGSVRLDRSIKGNLNILGPWRPGDEKIGAQNYFDLTGLVDFSERLSLRMGVNNIFDREPPIVSASGSNPPGVCTDPWCNGNTFPELYDPLGRYFFAGVTINY
jgi:outer membrane receptor protein involved in Fe transport